MCDDCFESLRGKFILPTCPECRTPTDGRYCDTHRGSHSLDGIIASFSFDEYVIREAIHYLKYNGIRELAAPLGRLIGGCIHGGVFGDALLVPVPLHPGRQAERGFNQAELLARQLPFPIALDVVKRTKHRPTQASLDGEARRQNLAGAFTVTRPELAQQKNIIVVDDVSTTGTTLEEIARVLKAAGARSAWGVVLARSV